MKRLIILAVFSVLLFGTSPVYAEEFREFSAVIIEKDGESTETNKIYAAIGKSRYDSKNGSEIVVTRYDKKLMWIIFPKYRRYVEEPCNEVQPQNPAPPQEGTFGDLTRKLVGTEFIDSYRTKKYLVTIKPRNEEKNQYQYYEWYRSDFPFPVKVAAAQGNSSTEYTKIKFGHLDPDLFSAPKSYKKVTLEEITEMEKSGTKSN